MYYYKKPLQKIQLCCFMAKKYRSVLTLFSQSFTRLSKVLPWKFHKGRTAHVYFGQRANEMKIAYALEALLLL